MAISLFDVNGRDAEPEPLADRALAALANATCPQHEQLVSTLEKFSDFLRDREHIGDSDRLGKETKEIRNRYSDDPYSVEFPIQLVQILPSIKMSLVRSPLS